MDRGAQQAIVQRVAKIWTQLKGLRRRQWTEEPGRMQSMGSLRVGQIGLLITSCQRLEKDSDSAIAPVPEAVSVPAHLAPPGSP